LVLNIEYDHPDFFPTESDYLQAFVDFIHKTRPEGKILLGGDDEGVQHLIDQVGDLSEKISCFGFNPTSDYRVIDHEILEHGQHFSLLLPNEEKIGPFRLPLPGKFNVLNAAAALAAAHLFGLDIKTLTDALIDFHGTSRRFDLVCQQGDVLVFNDYGHHPSQLRQTIQGARELYPYHSIWAVWEPHTISRTKRLHSEFASALCSADQSVILRLFGAREDDSSYSPEAIANEILDANCVYLPDNDQAASHILSGLTGKDVVLVFSAGKGPEFSQLLCEKIIREAQND
jgi:UDP-N-acetylmuramate--alanine ligase